MAEQLENHEIDKLVGQYVMGWTFVPGPEGSWYDAGVLLVATEDWSPTTDIRDAWQVVEKFEIDGYDVTVCTEDVGWGCGIVKDVDTDSTGYGDTAPIAIAKAALAAVGTATG